MANANNYEVPNWAGKPQVGLHLDVLKDGKLIQKLMIDEKKCYFFGRNKELCDFCIDHASCSRVHAMLVWHKHLNRPFLIDLGSTHGTFVGTLRLEPKKPQQVPLDSELHFGASTRKYVIREKPQMPALPDKSRGDGEPEAGGGLLGLPESEPELDNLTEYNTAHNKRIATVPDVPEVKQLKRRRKSASHVAFIEEEEVINPEDVDPSVGRFRNLIQTTVIPTKKQRAERVAEQMTAQTDQRAPGFSDAHHYSALETAGAYSVAARMGLTIPNSAPDVDRAPVDIAPATVQFKPRIQVLEEGPAPLDEPKKKKYAKEAWPGKRPSGPLLL